MPDSSASNPAVPVPAVSTPPVAAPTPVVVPPTPVLPEGIRLYECMWLVDANVGREDYNKVIAGLKEVVEKGGGAWINGDKWEERRLAYTIKKKKRGLYIISHFSAPTSAVIRIDRAAKLSDLVLRHMILVDEDGLTTSPPVRTIEDEDFGGPGGGERRFFGGGGGGGGGGDRGRGGSRPYRGGDREDRGPRPTA